MEIWKNLSAFGSIPGGATKNRVRETRLQLDSSALFLLWASSLVGKAPHLHCGDHGFDSHLCPLTFMPPYPIVGMDGTENPRKLVRLESLALFSDLNRNSW